MMWKSMITVGLVAAAAILILGASLASADKPDKPGKPGKPPQEPVDTGTIYFTCSHPYEVYATSPDGSEQQLLYTGEGFRGFLSEPSHLLHNGRWFLESRKLTWDSPSGGWRAELFAVHESGQEVQLTNDRSLENIMPSTYVRPRWLPGDAAVSWFARRWDLTDPDNPQLVEGEGGLYTLEIDFSSDQLVVGEPALLDWTADVFPTRHSSSGPIPDVEFYDWSPDGESIAFQTVTGGGESASLYVARSEGLSSVLATGVGQPRWSPDGTEIAFGIYNAGIHIINVESGDVRQLVHHGSTSEHYPVWSPAGTHLAYAAWKWGGNLSAGSTHYRGWIYRIAADGSGDTQLTDRFDSYAYTLGWRAE